MDKYRTTKALFYHKLRCSYVATPQFVQFSMEEVALPIKFS